MPRCIGCNKVMPQPFINSDGYCSPCLKSGKDEEPAPISANTKETETPPSNANQPEVKGVMLAEFFIAVGWVGFVVGVLIMVYAVINLDDTGSITFFAGIAVTEAGLITVLVGVIARAVVVNANTSLEILKQLKGKLS